ncbi:unnamed protein product [Oppiella nova]|uniref:Aminoglycoside phosphotransferase domain-containing protein n=1 Tax=Oppiella nova TaxID=334625 RepID=A0A7R9M7E0_9ACAR|nr:unnamed protein product [Oppiella nova]CAG2172178.1 unnamed protein product [Oppiella nova]
MKLQFNIENTTRHRMVSKFHEAGVRAIFAGHYHRNAGGKYEDLELVVTSAIGAQSPEGRNADSGYRVVTVNETDITHRYVNITTSHTNSAGSPDFETQLQAFYERNKCHTLMAFDMIAEIQWMVAYIGNHWSDCPLVFSHLDFRGANIMVTEHNGLVLCDFDYSAYGSRGSDFGTFFATFITTTHGFGNGFPLESVIKKFIGDYEDECRQLYGHDYGLKEYNSADYMLNECKFFVLVYFLFSLSVFSDEKSREESRLGDNTCAMIMQSILCDLLKYPASLCSNH